MLENLTFTTREEYFVWKAQWRTEYENVSLQIRKCKKRRNELFRNLDYAGNIQNLLLRYEYEANNLLGLRLESKKKSGQQRESNRLSIAA